MLTVYSSAESPKIVNAESSKHSNDKWYRCNKNVNNCLKFPLVFARIFTCLHRLSLELYDYSQIWMTEGIEKQTSKAQGWTAIATGKSLTKDGHEPRILLNSGHSQLGSAYYFVFNYVPRELRCTHGSVVKRRYNLIATAICVLSKCICPLGNWFSTADHDKNWPLPSNAWWK